MKTSCLKPGGLEPDIWYLASPSGPLPSLFRLYPWAKNGPALGADVLHRLILGKREKIFLSETIRPIVLIFVM